jgi:hypothetical protein
VENPIVCSNINKIGFRMSGGLAAYEDALRNRKFRAIAMSVFASGAIHPEEAIEWVGKQPNIRAIVFGASSERNIRSTVSLANEYLKVARFEEPGFAGDAADPHQSLGQTGVGHLHTRAGESDSHDDVERRFPLPPVTV